MNNTFELLTNLFNNLGSMIDTNNSIEKLDFTKKEDVEKLDKAISIIKNSDNAFIKLIIDEDALNKIQQNAHKIYNESEQKKLEAKRLEEKKKIEALNRQKRPMRPQLLVSENIKKSITNYACEYMNTMILPYSNLKQNQVQDILNGLIDFACWIYNYKK